MQKMMAALFRRYGGPEVIEVGEVSRPSPGADEVLIKSDSCGVGVPDLLIRSGQYAWAPPLPAVLGIELSGTVVEVGRSVSDIAVGQNVFLSARDLPFRAGCYAEYAVAPAQAVSRLPDGVRLDEAACLSNYQVAWHLLRHAAPGTGDVVLIHGASGGVGSALVQLCAVMERRSIAVCSTQEKCDVALANGAEATVNRSNQDVPERIKELTKGRGVDVVLDPVGGTGFPRNFEMVAPLGLIVIYGLLQGFPDSNLLGPMREHIGKSPAVRLFTMHTFDKLPEERRRSLSAVIALLEERRIRPLISHRMALSAAADAHRMLETGSVLGKIILHPQHH
ncbi:MAG TPA: zinc-dependent alcohol dehydrogenase family protein [Ramlibacter sp.]|uniref:quinone oxidoreductase family protein n=1 Tax=Ramlibacter sp. TaxID=1917967 RepID=UPI002BB5809A|nr:zinc-dependent alcohol dehydrogenase family protein [Ramlibacter sp.]HVZ45502.1 zinc-dependent alcohol dehydrogenase family protein [Ramlibacter sp.]